MTAQSNHASPTSASEVVSTDLAYIRHNLDVEFSTLSGKNLLITGGAGFLGYYLVQAVMSYNDVSGKPPVQLTVMDNFVRGTPPWIERLGGRDDARLLKHDIRDPLPEELGDLDFVIHAAGIASPDVYRRHPIETMDANVNGLRFLLDEAVAQSTRGQPISGFLFYSSSEIYGDPPPEQIPTPETYRGYVSCTGPRACYDESKRYGETLAVTFASQYDLPISIARPFNNYGPGMKINDGRVIADFCRAVIEDRDIVMFSDGAPTRTFGYVADAVVGYYKVLTRGGPGEPYNIGADEPEVSMAQLAETVSQIGEQLFGYDGDVVLGTSDDSQYLVDNPNRRCPDLTKARHDLEFRPGVDLESGVRRTLLWYKGNPEVVAE